MRIIQNSIRCNNLQKCGRINIKKKISILNIIISFDN